MPVAPTRHHALHRRSVALLSGMLAASALAACSVSSATPPRPVTSTTSAEPSDPGGTPSATEGPSPTTVPSVDPEVACARRTVASLSPRQRAGQLLMVGLSSSASATALDPTIRSLSVGGVVYLGRWPGLARTRTESAHLQGLATTPGSAGIPLLIAADQEGGQVQRISGPGISSIPSALAQGRLAPATLRALAATWAAQLAEAGVGVDLAPVAGTVPVGAENAPLGGYDRQFGSDPSNVAAHVRAFVDGMHEGGVETAVKHFPGLGRVRNNTDSSATGITDTQTAVGDPYLTPFTSGIEAGTGFVMVSLARYPRIDAHEPAVFSRAIITDLLRSRLGFTGVVLSDDLDARALASVPVQDRVTRFIAAGGDLTLITRASQAGVAVAGLLARQARDPAFAAAMARSVERVVRLKVRMGLIRCSEPPRRGRR